jgi:asparagine synthetase B (glutamine-hydrolysing)
MNEQELKQEVIDLAWALDDPDGLEYSTIQYVALELGINAKQVQVILTESLFDLE